MASRVITTSNETNFLRQCGPIFIDELRVDAAHQQAPERVRRDWSLVANWLSYDTGEFTQSHIKKIEKAWLAYLAIGLAPSHKLQPEFTSFVGQLKGSSNKFDRAPTEVMDVFDRLLASETEIESKRNADMKATKGQLQPFLDKLNRQKELPWWFRQSPLFRKWVFASAVWVALMFIYFGFFDPFDVGGWDRMNDEELMRFFLILMAPGVAGGAFYAYRRWVR